MGTNNPQTRVLLCSHKFSPDRVENLLTENLCTEHESFGVYWIAKIRKHGDSGTVVFVREGIELQLVGFELVADVVRDGVMGRLWYQDPETIGDG